MRSGFSKQDRQRIENFLKGLEYEANGKWKEDYENGHMIRDNRKLGLYCIRNGLLSREEHDRAVNNAEREVAIREAEERRKYAREHEEYARKRAEESAREREKWKREHPEEWKRERERALFKQKEYDYEQKANKEEREENLRDAHNCELIYNDLINALREGYEASEEKWRRKHIKYAVISLAFQKRIDADDINMWLLQGFKAYEIELKVRKMKRRLL
jgi:hypothetical protein